MNIIVISPHPDDAEYACGATIKKLVEAGHDVRILVINNAGNLTMKHSGETITMEDRYSEQMEACKELGCHFNSLNCPDEFHASKFDEVPMSRAVYLLDDYFTKFPPDTVLIPYPSYNQDHQYVYKAAMAALRPNVYPKVSVMCYEQPLDYHTGESLEGYTYYVPVLRLHAIAKQKALAAHESQLAGRFANNLLSEQAVDAQLRYRGLQCGSNFAECFKPIRVNYETLF
ncbi:MAG: PIG-L family deacetylase [Bacteroidaceae bacterium]